jgi:tetratricopeptide (TPR) repeat protein
MRDVAQRFPDDADAQVLFGEALMDTTPWNYWEENGQAKPVTDTILSTLESVLARLPNHPGANHFYIHAVEAEHPERGIKSAERLQDLVPGAGHLVHMPSHIFIRVGRYHEGSLANERAIAADDSYVTQCHAQGMYPIGYMPHNHHFLWATTTMEGRAQRALDAAQTLASHIDTSQMREPGFGTLQHYWVTPLYAQVRFGQWSDILDTNAPTDDLVYPTAVWHYAHAMARIRTGDLSKAEEHLTHLQRLASHPALEEVTIWDINTTADIMQVATRLVAGELAAAHGNMNEAVQHIREAVSLEDNLNYDEPPSWHHPVRQTLGAVLLQANRPVEAERAYREDLSRFPENGWSLLGLEQSLRAQGQAADAEEVRRQFDKAWQYADVNLISSRM